MFLSHCIVGCKRTLFRGRRCFWSAVVVKVGGEKSGRPKHDGIDGSRRYLGAGAGPGGYHTTGTYSRRQEDGRYCVWGGFLGAFRCGELRLLVFPPCLTFVFCKSSFSRMGGNSVLRIAVGLSRVVGLRQRQRQRETLWAAGQTCHWVFDVCISQGACSSSFRASRF